MVRVSVQKCLVEDGEGASPHPDIRYLQNFIKIDNFAIFALRQPFRGKTGNSVEPVPDCSLAFQSSQHNRNTFIRTTITLSYVNHQNQLSASFSLYHLVCIICTVIAWFGGQLRINFLSKILKFFCNRGKLIRN